MKTKKKTATERARETEDAALLKADELIKDYADAEATARGWYRNVEQWGEESWCHQEQVPAAYAAFLAALGEACVPRIRTPRRKAIRSRGCPVVIPASHRKPSGS